MKNKLLSILSLSLITLVMFSCSDFSKVLKSGTNEEKKDAALKYYGEEDYIKSITLLEDIIPYYKLTPDGDNLYFTYCMANYKLKDFYLSGFYFKRFIRQYPTSKNVEEATFLSALCAVNNSPNYKLDQTETLNALDELQIFIDLYPNSNRMDTCNMIMDKMRAKLELKQYESAMLYYKTENYQAAVVSFQGTLEKYPETKFKEEILYHSVKSSYMLAINSVESKKRERLEATLKSYSTFVAAFPESAWISDVEGIKSKTEKELSNMTK